MTACQFLASNWVLSERNETLAFVLSMVQIRLVLYGERDPRI